MTSMSEWLWYRFLIPGSPIALQYLAYVSMNQAFPFPPLTFAILACVFPSLTVNDYRKKYLVPICILPASFAGVIVVLAVQCLISHPTSPCRFHWYGFYLWLGLLIVNLLRKVEVFR